MALAKWYKIDFHTHTPASNCFPDKSVSASQWLDAAKRSGMNAVVVTDHNSVSFLSEIEKEKKNYEVEDQFKVFYGIELCVSAEFTHILIIFDDSLTLTQIEDAIISDLNLRREQWNNTEVNVSEDRLEQLYKKYKDKIFIIPAHFASNKGLGKASVNALKKYQEYLRFAAIEVRNEEDKKEYRNKVALNAINEASLISGSDNPSSVDESQHSIDGFGKRYTWIKLSKLNFNGLKQVFLDPEYRCINYLDLMGLGDKFNPNNVNHNYIAGLKLQGFKHLDNMDFRLSPYLNCIIGGRGTGKSTLVEAMHVGLSGKEDIGENKIIKSTIQKGGEIVAYYNFGSNIPYEITATKNGTKSLSFKYINDDGETSTPPEFVVDFYGQKEIFALIESDGDVAVQNESPLVRLIDGKLSTSIYSINDEIDILSNQLIQYSQQCSSNRVKVSEIATIKAEINKIEAMLSQYKESGLDAARINFERLDKLCLDCKNNLDESASLLGNIGQEMLTKIQDIDELHIFKKEDSDKYPEVPLLFTAIKDAYKSIFELTKEKSLELQKKQVEFTDSNLMSDKNEAQSQYHSALEKIRNTGSEDLKSIQEKLTSLKSRENFLLQVKHEQDKLLIKIKESIGALVEKRLELSSLRKSVANNEDISNIKISILPLGHKNRWKQNLQLEFGRENTFDSNFEQLVDFILDPDDNFKNYKEYIFFLLTSSDGNISTFYNTPITEGRFLKLWEDKQQKGTLSSLLNIIPEDLIKIRIVEGSEEIDINEGSPGQKSAAILAFILSSGDNPLIIDQPEDDLDNSLIYTLIVQSIRHIKNKRQIIIVTHNPNIPVLGDAEGIIVLERGKDGKVAFRQNKKAGCLEEKTIRDGICTIMEGGEDAFRKREEKYFYK